MSSRLAKLEGVRTCLAASSAASLKTCVTAARLLFNDKFVIIIKQLLHNFPVDYVDKSGAKFWSGPKRPPTPADFNADDELHRAFLVHATELFASNYCLTLPAGWAEPAALSALLATIIVPAFAPKNVTIKTGDADAAVEGGADDAEAAAAVSKELSALGAAVLAGTTPAFTLAPAEFEKDDDSNHHVDFVAAISNLRARNYAIPETSRHAVKMIAGKIIPAIATTTCAITGLVCLEFYKIVAHAGAAAEARLALARNSFMNLAVNVYSMAEPMPPKRTKDVEYDAVAMGPVRGYPKGFSRWDKLVARRANMTFGELEAWLLEDHGLDLSMVTSGRSILYYPLMYAKHKTERKTRAIADVLAEVTGKPLPRNRDYLTLDLSVSDKDGDVLVPTLQGFFKSEGAQ